MLRGGVLQGMYFQGRSTGALSGDYVCGVDNAAGAGVGILVKQATPSQPVPCLGEDDCENDAVCLDGVCVDDAGGAPAVTVRGVTTAYNADAGVRLSGYRSADFGADAADGAGRNAFTDNGLTVDGVPRLRRNFINVLTDTTALVPARATSGSTATRPAAPRPTSAARPRSRATTPTTPRPRRRRIASTWPTPCCTPRPRRR
ncbi:MAG: hypothetical protein U0802_13495 [Candidatus Binatia bacterium]